MIVDVALYESLKPYSNQSVLCRCDSCGVERLVKTYNITIKGSYTKCKRCTGVEWGHSGKNRRKRIPKKYSKNESYFSMPTLNNSYWAGYIAADGHLAKPGRSRCVLSFGIQCSDEILLQRLITDTQYTGVIRVASYTSKTDSRIRNSSQLNIASCDRWFSDLANNFSLSGNHKSATLLPPISLSLENSLAYIVGFIDGDGCIYQPKKGRIVLTIIGTIAVLEWVRSIFNEIVPPTRAKDVGIHPTQSAVCFQISYGGKRAQAILERLKLIPVRKLERKWDKIALDNLIHLD